MNYIAVIRQLHHPRVKIPVEPRPGEPIYIAAFRAAIERGATWPIIEELREAA